MPIQQMFLGLGGVSDVEYAASDNNTNIVLSTVFGSDWAANVSKIYTVASGVDVGGTNTHAIHADSGMGGTLSIVVAGTVTGFGGAGGAGGTGGFGAAGYSHTPYAATDGVSGTAGGTAIRIDSSNVTVTNTGTISGGGGGGGGSGGAGGYRQFVHGRSGGNGGAGGNGAGWNQSQSNGSSGTNGDGSYPGSAGGNGGTLGNNGQQGQVGNNYGQGYSSNRSPGGNRGDYGAAGAAIAGSSYTLSNSGTINGSS